jgi:hypothetical protein
VLKKAIRIAFLLPYWRTNRRLRYTGGALLGSETTTDERLELPWQRFIAGAAPGLTIDAMADGLGTLLDEADLAAIRGDHATLTRAITELARRLLQILSFADRSGRLPGHP